jgi:hypothetical protein
MMIWQRYILLVFLLPNYKPNEAEPKNSGCDYFARTADGP